MYIDVHVKPRSKHTQGLLEQADGSFVLYTHEPPVDGRANAAALAALAKHFGVTKANVRLVRGATARNKLFEVCTV